MSRPGENFGAIRLTKPQPVFLRVLMISQLGWLVPLLVGVAVLLIVTVASKNELPLWLWLLVSAPWIICAGVDTWRSVVMFRHHGWNESEEDFLVVRGGFWRQLTAVPYGRIQYAEVTQGPLMRAFGLASVELHTASQGSHASVQGLRFEEAEELRERLVSRGSARLAGL